VRREAILTQKETCSDATSSRRIASVMGGTDESTAAAKEANAKACQMLQSDCSAGHSAKTRLRVSSERTAPTCENLRESKQ
jgi:hypothetical protein